DHLSFAGSRRGALHRDTRRRPKTWTRDSRRGLRAPRQQSRSGALLPTLGHAIRPGSHRRRLRLLKPAEREVVTRCRPCRAYAGTSLNGTINASALCLTCWCADKVEIAGIDQETNPFRDDEDRIQT